MVASSRIDGGTQILTASVRNTIQSIKEIVGNHSDAEIYATLKETDMDPNKTTEKLLLQDPFHEVRRKRDKKKENTGYKGLIEPRKPIEHAGQGVKFNAPDRGVERGGYSRNAVLGGSREFRIVRDNRISQDVGKEMKPSSSLSSVPTSDLVNSNFPEKGSTRTSNNQNSSGGRYSSQGSVTSTVLHNRQSRDTNSIGTTGKESPEERRAPVQTSVKPVHASKSSDSQPHSAMLTPNVSVAGVYSSSSDPVHVPSPDSRSAATAGKREFGAVGVRRRSSENSVKSSSPQSTSLSNAHLGRDGTAPRESIRPFTATSRGEQPDQTTVRDSVVPSMLANKQFSSNQYNNRLHQQVATHHKASQPNKEWKPKSSKKSTPNGPGIIGQPAKSVLHAADNPKDLEIDAAQVLDKLSLGHNNDTQKVIIAAHIQVAEPDRCRLTFGSFGTEFDSSMNFASESNVGSAANSPGDPSASSSVSVLESSHDEISANKHLDLHDSHDQNSGTNSPASAAVSEHQLPDNEESSSLQNLDSFADIGLVRDSSPSYTHSESQQHQDPSEIPSFSAYEPQAVYDIPYFRPSMDATVRGQGLPSLQETLSSQSASSIPSSTIPMILQQHQQQQQLQQQQQQQQLQQQQQQQQQQQMAQLYPQVQVPHFANLMPYRQFLSPVYAPMPMPGYSSNPTYPHPSNGSSYLLMPGGSSHLGANNLKYGIQQFKPIPAGSPTGFGNFTNPTGYAINTPGVVGSAAGVEDSSRLKYKDGNLYVPNPQAETSEIWIQNPRELSSLQSGSYYNMPAQTPHAAYLPSHTGHASFNAAAAVAQSSHMQFPGLYHPTQQAAIANPHHLGPAMAGNVGVGVAAAAPGAQVGAYQPAQLGHLNWSTNF